MMLESPIPPAPPQGLAYGLGEFYLLPEVAAYFQALAEPTRLQLLNILRDGERNVGELAQLCGTTAANVSRYLSLLTKYGMVHRLLRHNSARIDLHICSYVRSS